MTKAQEIHERVQQLIAAGTPKAEAFKQIAKEEGRPVDSIRGAFYASQRQLAGGTKAARPRRRETTPDDALADARAALERSIQAIDREVEAAKTRAEEAAAEYEAIHGSAEERKSAITERLESLK